MKLYISLFLLGISKIASASGAQGGSESIISGIMPMVLIMVVFYFLLIRPQQKRSKSHQEMIASLQKGNDVILQCGIIGKIIKTDDELLSLEISEGVRIKVKKEGVLDIYKKPDTKPTNEIEQNG